MEQAIWVLSDGKKEMQNFEISFGIACDETEGEGVVLQCGTIYIYVYFVHTEKWVSTMYKVIEQNSKVYIRDALVINLRGVNC